MAKHNLDDVTQKLVTEDETPQNKANRINRVDRVPIGTPRGRLEVRDKEPGFHYTVINDYNVDEALDQGFEFVTHPVRIGTRRIGVGRRDNGSAAVHIPVGGGVIGYLMRIPQEIYDDDMKKYHKNVVDSTEESIRSHSSKNSLQGTLEITRKSE